MNVLRNGFVTYVMFSMAISRFRGRRASVTPKAVRPDTVLAFQVEHIAQ